MTAVAIMDGCSSTGWQTNALVAGAPVDGFLRLGRAIFVLCRLERNEGSPYLRLLLWLSFRAQQMNLLSAVPAKLLCP